MKKRKNGEECGIRRVRKTQNFTSLRGRMRVRRECGFGETSQRDVCAKKKFQRDTLDAKTDTKCETRILPAYTRLIFLLRERIVKIYKTYTNVYMFIYSDSPMFKSLFPLFTYHPNLVYLDSVASTLKPQSVLDALSDYYQKYSVNIARGIYPLSEKATLEYERVRKISAHFIGAENANEIVFTRNTTESLNLVAYGLESRINPGDEIAVTEMEHHANFVPWQQLAERRGAKFIVIPFDDNGEIAPETLRQYLTPKTKIFAFSHASNVLGTINPAKECVRIAKEINQDIITVIDGAQSTPHFRVDVTDISCDFFAFSSHKIFGPTGAGILWGKFDQLQTLPPFLFGGEMIDVVTKEKTTFQRPPHRFEAGTPAIGEVIGMGAAMEFIEHIGYAEITRYENTVAEYAFRALYSAFGDTLHIVGPRELEKRVPLFSFTLDGVHPHDIAQVLAEDSVCIRAGSHCAMPLHFSLPLDSPATARIGISIYTTKEDIDACIISLKKAKRVFTSQI